MKTIEFVRIDERLVHGQILTKWIDYTKCDEVMIIDEEVYSDPIIKSVIKMSFPKSIDFEVYNLELGAKALCEEDAQNKKILLLIKRLQVFNELKNLARGIQFSKINIARLPFEEGKRKLYENVYVSKEDLTLIKNLSDEGLCLTIQMVPDSEAINLRELIENE